MVIKDSMTPNSVSFFFGVWFQPPYNIRGIQRSLIIHVLFISQRHKNANHLWSPVCFRRLENAAQCVQYSSDVNWKVCKEHWVNDWIFMKRYLNRRTMLARNKILILVHEIIYQTVWLHNYKVMYENRYNLKYTLYYSHGRNNDKNGTTTVARLLPRKPARLQSKTWGDKVFISAP